MSRGEGRALGRPRDAATDAAILKAAVELVSEVGAERTTLAAIARRAGVARATVYLRWPNRSALIGNVGRAVVGGRPFNLTGDLEQDLRDVALFIQKNFASEAAHAVLPEFVRGLLTRPPELSFDQVFPSYRPFAELYRNAAAAAGLDPDVDPKLPADLMIGATIVALLRDGRPMSPADAEKVMDVILRGLRRDLAVSG